MEAERPIRVVALSPPIPVGRLLLDEVQIYDDHVVVRWQWAESPPVDGELRAQNRAMVELMGSILPLRLADDAQTEFRHAGTFGGSTRVDTHFEPTPPPAAQELTFSADGQDATVRLTAG